MNKLSNNSTPTNQEQMPFMHEPKLLTVEEAIVKLRSYAMERWVALSAHSSVPNMCLKIVAVEQVLRQLDELKLRTDYVNVALVILRMNRQFMFVAPRKNLSVFNAYADKIDEIMSGFRDMILYLKSKQTN